MRIGLYFGTFNPIHIGHMAIANYLLEYAEIERLWFVVSPQSPFKQQANLLDNHQRLELLRRAIGNNPKCKVSDVEFELPTPSYTADTLAHLRAIHPELEFYLLMGGDNLQQLHRWKNYETILQHHHILAYPRPASPIPVQFQNHPSIRLVDAPLMEISSSFIRKAIAEGKDMRYFLPFATWQYLQEKKFYTE